ncbi:MAG: general secretion pathway protein GspK [Candidatus Hydrogenedentes bacterium]|nr:general secretion pathway protein GspK [Candidatus Hydrogenedentota bacterium]
MTRRGGHNRGSALVFALAILGIIVTFGFAMYRFTLLESDALGDDIDRDRARWDAASGVEHAIAELQTAIGSGQVDALLKPEGVAPVSLGIYRLASTLPNSDASLIPDDRYESSASVTISDECARMNVNLAPPAVLISMLKIDGEKARQVREKLPRLDGAPASPEEGRRWLSSVDELSGLQVLAPDTLTPERVKDLTVFSALDMQNAAGYVNLNTASSAVIEAALGVTPEVAAKVIAARPLNSLDALVAATGKDPNGFNFKPAADNPSGLPRELAFSSRCFRITSTATLTRKATQDTNTATVEAVVQFPEGAAPRIVYWNEPSVGANTGK